ncbi:MAG: mycofactocin precursor MftA [Streptosporangiaceae bacterium]
MQQDTRADVPQALAQPAAAEVDISEDLRDLGEHPGITGELLVEEVSIDGMCGVY